MPTSRHAEAQPHGHRGNPVGHRARVTVAVACLSPDARKSLSEPARSARPGRCRGAGDHPLPGRAPQEQPLGPLAAHRPAPHWLTGARFLNWPCGPSRTRGLSGLPRRRVDLANCNPGWRFLLSCRDPGYDRWTSSMRSPSVSRPVIHWPCRGVVRCARRTTRP